MPARWTCVVQAVGVSFTAFERVYAAGAECINSVQRESVAVEAIGAHGTQACAPLRFEVMGTMTASLLSTETLHVLNLGACGALVEAGLALPANAEDPMQLVLESHVSEVTVKVRRVTAVAQESGGVRYRIGLEFLAISPEAADVIKQVVLVATSNQARV